MLCLTREGDRLVDPIHFPVYICLVVFCVSHVVPAHAVQLSEAVCALRVRILHFACLSSCSRVPKVAARQPDTS